MRLSLKINRQVAGNFGEFRGRLTRGCHSTPATEIRELLP